MNDLLEKLEAEINELERIALAASGPKGIWPSWETSEYFGYETPHVLIGLGNQRQPLSGGHFTYTPVEKRFADHIVRSDPARVLRRVARDRKLLARHCAIDVDEPEPDGNYGPGEGVIVCSRCGGPGALVPWPCDDVWNLAEDYEIEVEH